MPSLSETLLEYDRDILEMIAERWGCDYYEGTNEQITLQITAHISNIRNLNEVLVSLNTGEVAALEMLLAKKGRQPLDKLTREFGVLREMGAGRRAKIKPHQTPVSITESLFYRALVGKAYLKVSDSLLETIYIPDDLIESIQNWFGERRVEGKPGFEARSVDISKIADDGIVDPIVTTMAGLRKGMPDEKIAEFLQGTSIALVKAVLTSAGILSHDRTLNQTRTKQFLQSKRASMLAAIERSWVTSNLIHELREIPSLTVEIASGYTPEVSRQRVIDLINMLPIDSWVTISEFCEWVKNHHPDLLRKGGDYDAWFIKEKETGLSLKGFENWLSIEGAYLRYLIISPLHTFGLVDLGKRIHEPDFLCFKKSTWFKSLYSGNPLDYKENSSEKIFIDPNGIITIDKRFPPELRYILARCCAWEKVIGNRYIYRIEAASLKAIRGQGIKTGLIINLIRQHGRKPIPENILAALARWEANGNESIIRPAILLNVKSKEIVDQLIEATGSKWIARKLNPTCVELKEGSENQVLAALLKMGVFADIKPDL